MRVHLETVLPCDADDAWVEVQTSRLLCEIASPLVRLAPVNARTELPRSWRTLGTERLRPYLFGFIPWGVRTLCFEQINDRRREIQTREYDSLVARWDHHIRLEPIDADHCRYIDDVEIVAGVLTPLVWLFAQWFYRHRQQRWHIVARRLHAIAADAAAMMGHA